MSNNESQLGNNIRTARQQAGISQTKLAEMLGTTQAMIARYESNEQEPTVSRLKEIARALNVKTADLIE